MIKEKKFKRLALFALIIVGLSLLRFYMWIDDSNVLVKQQESNDAAAVKPPAVKPAIEIEAEIKGSPEELNASDQPPFVDQNQHEIDEKKHQELELNKQQEEADAKKEQEEADAKKQQEEADAKKQQEEADAKKQQEEADAKKQQEEADAKKQQEEADAKKQPAVDEIIQIVSMLNGIEERRSKVPEKKSTKPEDDSQNPDLNPEAVPTSNPDFPNVESVKIPVNLTETEKQFESLRTGIAEVVKVANEKGPGHVKVAGMKLRLFSEYYEGLFWNNETAFNVSGNEEVFIALNDLQDELFWWFR